MFVISNNGPYDANGDVPTSGRIVSDRKSTRLNSSHTVISYAVFCLKKKKDHITDNRPGSSSTTQRKGARYYAWLLRVAVRWRDHPLPLDCASDLASVALLLDELVAR